MSLEKRLSNAVLKSAIALLCLGTLWRYTNAVIIIIICPIAIVYSMGQIIKSVCVCVSVCLCVCLSVCEHSHGRIS